MRVFLTGATGAIGGSILESLIKSGHHVVCFVRSISKAQSLVAQYGDQVSLLEIDNSIDPAVNFRTASQGFDKICHSGYAYTEAEKPYEDSVLQGLLDSAKETSQSKPVTFIFTTGCLIVGEQQTLLGESQTSSANSIDLTKWRIPHEEITLAANTENLHASILRPGFLYGGSAVDQWFKVCKTQGKIVAPVQEGRVSYIHREDLANFFTKVLENHCSGIFNISEGVGPNVTELIEIAKKLTGIQVVERVENVWPFVHDFGFHLFGMTVHQMLDSERGRELFGFTPKHNINTEAEQLIKLD